MTTSPEAAASNCCTSASLCLNVQRCERCGNCPFADIDDMNLHNLHTDVALTAAAVLIQADGLLKKMCVKFSLQLSIQLKT